MSDYGFRVPVSGQKIPHGWFAALVRFMNSLVLRGDGRFTMVIRDESGTSVTLTPAAVAALTRAAGGPPGAGGVVQGFNVRTPAASDAAVVELVSGGTHSITFEGAGGVTVTGGTDGTVLITGSTGSSAVLGFPDYTSVVWSIDSDHPSPSLPASLQYAYPVWLVGTATVQDGQEIEISFYPSASTPVTHVLAAGFFEDSVTDEVTIPAAIPIAANVPFQLRVDPDASPPAYFKYRIFSCIS